MKQNDSGFVLICVLWVLAIITVLTLSLGHVAMLDERAAAQTIDYAQAHHLARGAVERGRLELVIQQQRELVGELVQSNAPQTAASWPKEIEAKALFAVYDEESGDDKCGAVIRDESGRINLNAAPEEVLDEIEELDFSAVSDIMERRGENAGAGPERPFLTIEELRALADISDSAWYGHGDKAGLRDMFTIYGDGLINVNAASREVLMAVPGLSEGDADAIVAYRAGDDGALLTGDDRRFAALDDVSRHTGVSTETAASLARYCKVDSGYFRITGFATRRQGLIRAECTAFVQVTEQGTIILEWREGGFGV